MKMIGKKRKIGESKREIREQDVAVAAVGVLAPSASLGVASVTARMPVAATGGAPERRDRELDGIFELLSTWR